VYDFLKDPLDRTDVAAAHPDVVQPLAKALEGWRGVVSAARLKPDAELPQTLSAEEMQRLKALGYIK
jgi:hypothetical protein